MKKVLCGKFIFNHKVHMESVNFVEFDDKTRAYAVLFPQLTHFKTVAASLNYSFSFNAPCTCWLSVDIHNIFNL